MAVKIESLPGHAFGALVRDLARTEIDDPRIRKDLYELWIDKGLLVFRGTDGERETQLELSRVFGEFELHPVRTARLAEAPELTPLHYDPDSGFIVVVDGETRGAYLPWHSDLIYVDRINRGGLLRPVRVPSRGGYTGFIDQIDLYEKLPADLKGRIDGLNVVYHADFDMELKKFGKKVRVKRYLQESASRHAAVAKYPCVVHPMVFVQQETGRKVLNVSPWFALAIEGMEGAEGDALLARIVDHCEDDRNAYYHRWQPGDMVLWDNWRMLHCSYGVPLDETRSLERTTIRGDYRLGRIVGGTAISEEQRVDV
jgi:taurine dioxygenase